ncbi:hypothetical protein ABF87_03635 [Nitrosomonas sp. JL21]|uniref:hypothetical protein n=1 Tax=Nitrosomonas sp. JL21 TaxID=153949 RepID=UPI00136F3600|nr:hypothetical protein [Nitrosomonas sp. JL21]MXS77063.1 hypothetical protein [Nitrosomonas sp. JL21]
MNQPKAALRKEYLLSLKALLIVAITRYPVKNNIPVLIPSNKIKAAEARTHIKTKPRVIAVLLPA